MAGGRAPPEARATDTAMGGLMAKPAGTPRWWARRATTHHTMLGCIWLGRGGPGRRPHRALGRACSLLLTSSQDGSVPLPATGLPWHACNDAPWYSGCFYRKHCTERPAAPIRRRSPRRQEVGRGGSALHAPKKRHSTPKKELTQKHPAAPGRRDDCGCRVEIEDLVCGKCPGMTELGGAQQLGVEVIDEAALELMLHPRVAAAADDAMAVAPPAAEILTAPAPTASSPPSATPPPRRLRHARRPQAQWPSPHPALWVGSPRECAKPGWDQGAKHGSDHCIAHGGRLRCAKDECTAAACPGHTVCRDHGGGKRYIKKAAIQGCCCAHGGCSLAAAGGSVALFWEGFRGAAAGGSVAGGSVV
mmetsp:Transcript_33676/g.108773  ORF Transcript_33676/g.108773 Transcript_33676/m.108773 type:complete len:361 (-) Transcript_33676:6-1088(-)